MSMPNEHSHEHPHPRSADAIGPFSGPPRTMFYLGLFVGIAACTTLALLFVVWSIASGKGLSVNAGTTNQIAQAPLAPTAPSPDGAQVPPVAAAPVKPVDESTDHILGPKNAKVTLIEYSDFECPFCKRHYDTLKAVMQQYPNDVRLVYRHFPLSFHQNAMKEAEASECAAEIGGNDAFWKMHDKIFTETTANGTGFSLDRLVPAAKEIGLDEKKFKDCLDSGKYVAKINQQMQEGGEAGVQGTPGTFVNGQLVEGAVPASQFTTIIDSLLKS